jgi:hypothetical protein
LYFGLEHDDHYQVNNYGISQNPDTKVYVLIFNNKYFCYYCKKCGDKFANSLNKWCKSCRINQLKSLTNWTSKNEIIDNFIQEKQLKYYGFGIIFEWIPYDELIDIGEIEDKCLTTAIWKEGPLRYDKDKKEWVRTSYERVCLIYLHNLQDIDDEFIIKVLNFSANLIGILTI